MKTVALVGTFDSKGEEFAFLKEQIERRGVAALTVDVGAKGPPAFPPDITAAEVVAFGGGDLEKMRAEGTPHALVMTAAGKGLAPLLKKLADEGKIQGVVAMGGGQGTIVLREALVTLPIGMPKILVTTMAGAGSRILGRLNDTHLVDPVVDFSGLNDILRPIISQTAAAIAGMVEVEQPPRSGRTRVAVSMFGQTTACVDECRRLLTEAGYDVYPFHANGMGCATMEALIDQGFFDAVLDISTTELLQEMTVPGTGNLGRVEAAGRRGVPQVVVPGALDSTNILAVQRDQFPGRVVHPHNEDVLLMRARPEDERAVGKVLAEKLNRSTGKTVVVMPMGGFSHLSELHPDPEADRALLETLKSELRPGIEIKEFPERLNDPVFAKKLCAVLTELVPAGQGERSNDHGA